MQLDGLFASDDLHATFHDASVERLTLDYVEREAVLDCLICVGDPGSADEQVRGAKRKGRVIFLGLMYCIIEPPDPAYPYGNSKGLSISDEGPVDASAKSAKNLPTNLPGEAFSHYFFVTDWNAFIYIAGEIARFEWTD